jgi:selenocysteine-specific elongation factor
LGGTSLEGAPIIRVSGRTGAGLDELTACLDALAQLVGPAADLGRGRLAVDRTFSLAGFGTVVTGTLRGGSLTTGDLVEIQPAGIAARIRGIQIHGSDVERAAPGNRTAINLTGVDPTEVVRGDWVAAPGATVASRLLDVDLRVLGDAAVSVRHDDEVHVHHGAAHVSARLRLIGTRELRPGDRGFGQLVLARPLAVAADDRFVLRRPSPGSTLGGGRILYPRPPRRWPRFRDASHARLEQLATGDHDGRIWHAIDLRGPSTAPSLTTVLTGVPEADRLAALESLTAAGRVVALGDLYLSDARWSRLRRNAIAVLDRYHGRYPLRPGPPREELRSRLGLAPEAFGGWLAAAAAEGFLAVDAETVRRPDHAPTLDADRRAAARAVVDAFRQAPFTPPALSDATQRLGREVVAFVLARGDLVQVAPDVALEREAYSRVLEVLAAALENGGTITVADLRDALGTSRKYALAIFEHTDRERITRRVGDARVAGIALRHRSPS